MGQHGVSRARSPDGQEAVGSVISSRASLRGILTIAPTYGTHSSNKYGISMHSTKRFGFVEAFAYRGWHRARGARSLRCKRHRQAPRRNCCGGGLDKPKASALQGKSRLERATVGPEGVGLVPRFLFRERPGEGACGRRRASCRSGCPPRQADPGGSPCPGSQLGVVTQPAGVTEVGSGFGSEAVKQLASVERTVDAIYGGRGIKILDLLAFLDTFGFFFFP